MCVIVYKPKDVSFPDYDTLRECWNRNSDGAGYMFPYNDSVVIRKGFMTLHDLLCSLCKDINTTGNKIPYVLHFRITTQGGVKPELTHPYPLSRNMEDLKLLQSNAKIAVAHNGIISLTKSSYVTEYNDTMKFVTDYLSLLIKNEDFYKDEDTLTLIEKLCGSKLCLLDHNGHVQMIGDFEKDGDCYYSNLSHKPREVVTYTKTEEKKKEEDEDNSSMLIHYFSCCKDFNKDSRYNFIPGKFCPACVCGELGYCGNCKYIDFCKKEGYYDRFRN